MQMEIRRLSGSLRNVPSSSRAPSTRGFISRCAAHAQLFLGECINGPGCRLHQPRKVLVRAPFRSVYRRISNSIAGILLVYARGKKLAVQLNGKACLSARVRRSSDFVPSDSIHHVLSLSASSFFRSNIQISLDEAVFRQVYTRYESLRIFIRSGCKII